MPQTVSAVFSDKGQSTAVGIRHRETLRVTVDLSGDFDGRLYLEKTTGGQVWDVVRQITADETRTYKAETQDERYRLRCEYAAGEVSLTGTADCTLTEAVDTIEDWPGPDGVSVFKVKEDGVETPKVTTPALVLTGVPQSAVGAGAVAGSGVVAQELGDGIHHKTVLTLTNVPVPIVSVTTGNGVGGVKVYDFPEGFIKVDGCVASLSVAVDVAEQDNFTDGTPEGDIGIGTVIPANADAFGTDATDDDLGAAEEILMAAFAQAGLKCPTDAVSLAAPHDGTATAKDVNVNALIDAADIDDDASTEILVSGTITIHWKNLGDY